MSQKHERLRCTQCDRIVSWGDLKPHRHVSIALRDSTEYPISEDSPIVASYHHRWVRGLSTHPVHCGPVVVEHLDPYVSQFEAFYGITT